MIIAVVFVVVCAGWVAAPGAMLGLLVALVLAIALLLRRSRRGGVEA